MNAANTPNHGNPPRRSTLEYVIDRGTDLGPVGTDFAATCDQVDQADAMLTGLRERVSQGLGMPEPAWPDTEGQRAIALVRRDPDSRMITLVLDATTANIALHAIAVHASDREAHVREVQQYGYQLHEDSYGRRNREAIAARETRVAARLRAIERAYRTAIDPDATLEHDPAKTPRSAAPALGYDLELE